MDLINSLFDIDVKGKFQNDVRTFKNKFSMSPLANFIKSFQTLYQLELLSSSDEL